MSRGWISVEVQGGLFHDSMDDADVTGGRACLRVALAGSRVRVFQDVARGRAGGIAPTAIVGPTEGTWRHDWLLSTTGVDYTLRPGAVAVVLRGGVGLAWVNVEADEGDPQVPPHDFRRFQHLLVGVVLERELARTVVLAVDVTDRVMDLFGDPFHLPGVDVGLRYRFR